MDTPIIILGSGLAGYHLAREIRQRDQDVPLCMLTRDAGHFYSKPMLSTAMGMGKEVDVLMSMPAEKMAQQYHMDIVTHTEVTSILPQENSLCVNSLHSGVSEVMNYRALILCIGAEPRIPVLEGNAQADVLSVNDVYQYQLFREKLVNKKQVVLLGAGLVGCEFANDLTRAGYAVDIVEPASTPLASLLPPEIGIELQRALERQGARWHCGRTAKSVDYNDDAYSVMLDDGSSISADIVFSAIGLSPRTGLAAQAGIYTERGICVNEYLQTNLPNIYAIGDCAEINHWILPYIAPIMHCSKALAASLLGELTPAAFPVMPVVIKTSAYPVVVCRPRNMSDTQWVIKKNNHDFVAELRHKDHQLVGFILTGEFTKERAELMSRTSVI
ncbi:MAG: FAD-dependent oxidoreductase [Gammaproteobacteria bacterium]|nr:FAD-dependent oxidoreductase [Gammaproteobacteria bacterium]